MQSCELGLSRKQRPSSCPCWSTQLAGRLIVLGCPVAATLSLTRLPKVTTADGPTSWSLTAGPVMSRVRPLRASRTLRPCRVCNGAVVTRSRQFELTGILTPLPPGGGPVPGEIVEHQAHAPGHAAVLVADRGVLTAGDMLSDVLIPLLDPRRPDQVGAYETALDRLGEAARHVDVLVPGRACRGATSHVGSLATHMNDK